MEELLVSLLLKFRQLLFDYQLLALSQWELEFAIKRLKEIYYLMIYDKNENSKFKFK